MANTKGACSNKEMQGLLDSAVSPFVLCLSDPRAVAHNVFNRFVFRVSQTSLWVLLRFIDWIYRINFQCLTLSSHKQPFRLIAQTSCSHWLYHPSPSKTPHVAFYSLFSLSSLALSPLDLTGPFTDAFHAPSHPSGKQHRFIASVLS